MKKLKAKIIILGSCANERMHFGCISKAEDKGDKEEEKGMQCLIDEDGTMLTAAELYEQ